jgi:DNA-binding transcriptional regulator YdaS (Cro superfamily)
MPVMEMTEVFRAAGGVMKLARALGLHHATLLGWKQVPPKHVPAVSKITDIPRHKLCPGLWESPPESGQTSADVAPSDTAPGQAA